MAEINSVGTDQYDIDSSCDFVAEEVTGEWLVVNGRNKLLNKEPDVEVSDTTEVDSSSAVGA